MTPTNRPPMSNERLKEIATLAGKILIWPDNQFPDMLNDLLAEVSRLTAERDQLTEERDRLYRNIDSDMVLLRKQALERDRLAEELAELRAGIDETVNRLMPTAEELDDMALRTELERLRDHVQDFKTWASHGDGSLEELLSRDALRKAREG